MQLALLSLLSALCSLRCAEGFELLGSSPLSRAQLPAPISRASPVMAGKGFGKSPPPPPKPKKKSAASVKRDAAGSAFDALKASGSPEYMVCIRTVDTSGKQSQWMPVGGIAVPRSNSEDTALSMAIFNNEDDLLKGAFRAYPKLKNSKDKFEYGYRLKDFPDDPIRLATKEKTEQTSNPLMQWFNTLDSPLNKS